MTPDAPARVCANCAAGMERHQDWCLECGTAAPGRLAGLRPGWRAVATTLALTVALVGGAGAASYAALNSDPDSGALAGTSDSTVAQVPPPATTPAPVVPGPTGPEGPTVETDPPELPQAPKVTPITPDDDAGTTATVTPPPTVTPPSSSSGSGTGSGSGSSSKADAKDEEESDATAAGDRGTGTSAGGDDDTASDAPLEAIAGGTVSVYDPLGRATATGEPGLAADGDEGTELELAAPDDDEPMQVGVVVDLGERKQVRAIEFTTTTPGGRVELYTTDSSTLPPEIGDTRWDHPSGRAKAAKRERLVLPRGGTELRHITLWFTTPPPGGPKVAIGELTVLG